MRALGKIVRHHSELPEWFREANYLAADGFSDFDWYVNVRMRRHVWHLDGELRRAKDSLGGDFPATKERIDGLVNERSLQLQVIRNHLNGPIPTDTRLTELGPAFQGHNSITANDVFDPVTRMTVSDLYAAVQELPFITRNRFISYLKSGTSLETLVSESTEAASWMHLALIEIAGESREILAALCHAYGMLKIDLSIPDDLLEQSFRRFLENARSDEQAWALGVDQKIKLQYQNWVDYGVLPYIDLTTWAQNNDRTITAAYAVKAFEEFNVIRDPEFRYSAYTIDTTVKKYVHIVLSSQVSSRLLEGASKEIERRVQLQAGKS